MITANDSRLREAISVARETLAGCPGVDPNEVDGNAASIVIELYRAGYVAVDRIPDREKALPITQGDDR